MEQVNTVANDIDHLKVLASVLRHGHRFQLIEHDDGSFVIVRNGTEEASYSKGMRSLEFCISAYMDILRLHANA